MKNKALERRLAWLLISQATFTADDLTDDGNFALDPDHGGNGAQSGIGAFINSASRRRLIEFTGAVVKSKAPYRKGGVIRVWAPTTAGRLWAKDVLAEVTT